MSHMAPALMRAYQAAASLVTGWPELWDFAGWPEAKPAPRPPRSVPVAPYLRHWTGAGCPATADLHAAIRDLTDCVAWQQTYRVDEVGADFLDRYGWFELVGPTGHFQSNEIRASVAFWGERLHYPWHLHQAEELYLILAGHAVFEAEGQAARSLGPGDIQIHTANQPHAMRTTDSPVLTFVLWRGDGLDDLPRMGRA